jgi:hypothetical protein
MRDCISKEQFFLKHKISFEEALMLYDYAKGNEETFKMLIEFLKVYKK